MTSAKTWAREWRVLLEWVAGFAATIFFHQPALWILHRLGMTPRLPYAMTPVPPFGVPAVISLAFWGGIWGLVLIPAISRMRSDPGWYVSATAAGAIFPTLVAGLIVAPLKHQPLPHTAAALAFGLIVNGAWGLGTAVFFRLMTGTR
jgi:hypothetical protein